MELIDRQAAIDAIYACHSHGKNLKRFVQKMGHSDAYSDGILDAVSAVEDLDEAPLPIKTKCCFCPHCRNCDVADDGTHLFAHWIDEVYVPSHTKYTCSSCGKGMITNSEYIKEHKFCFHCGADMRDENGETMIVSSQNV